MSRENDNANSQVHSENDRVDVPYDPNNAQMYAQHQDQPPQYGGQGGYQQHQQQQPY
jgi:hypothetical protein